MKGILILLCIIALVLIPLWPYEVKYFMWIVSYYVSMFFVGIIIARLVLYLFISIFGVSFWLFPRLFDNCDTIDSFIPVVSFTKWEGSSIYNIITRLIILSIFCYYGFHIYNDPTIIDGICYQI
jgi:translocation protein SEC62